jgi:hypothetical protein
VGPPLVDSSGRRGAVDDVLQPGGSEVDYGGAPPAVPGPETFRFVAVNRDEAVDELVAATQEDLALLWKHVPVREQPKADDPLEYRRDSTGHLVIRWRPPATDVVDTISLAGFDHPDGVAAFRVRRWPSGNRTASAWRDRKQIGVSAVRDATTMADWSAAN